MALMSVVGRRLFGVILAGAALGSPTIASAQEGGISGLVGVWKISQPTFEVRPVSGSIPFTAEGRERYQENKSLRAKGKIAEFDITRSRCSNPGVPRLALTPMRFKIWTHAEVVTFDYEWNRAIRQVDMTGAEKEVPLVPNITGQARGTWENGVFVARTIDVADKTLIDDLVPHSDQMVVTERYRLVDANTLENRVTIEDPAFFTRPWEFVVTYNRQADTIFPEDVCLDRVQAGASAFPEGES